MDYRTALQTRTRLCFSGKNDEKIYYTIVREIGRGSSCIVYEVEHETTTGDTKLYRLKEFYPYKLHIKRDNSGRLMPEEAERLLYEEMKDKMREDFKIANKLFYSEGTIGMLTDQLNVYDYNDTTYVVSAFSAEKTLLAYKPISIKECLSLVKQVAYIVEKVHRQGYLYLDMKPQNVLVLEGYQSRVQLFDFDSLISLKDIREKSNSNYSDLKFSYSKGFAAVELQTAKIKRIGYQTDIFAVGALLYYLLFGYVPTAPDCESDATYQFDEMRYSSKKCDDQLFNVLADFFHNTLANYYLDRYECMNDVLDKLVVLELLADENKPRIYSTRFPYTTYVVGREKEFKKIDEFISDSEQHCMYVTGMGGIGKSTLIRGYMQKRKHIFDTVLYMQFEGSMETTIANDNNVHINTLKNSENEISKDRYFDKKVRKIRELVEGKKALIVIDNFGGAIDKDTLKVLQIGCKVIIVSRNKPDYRNGTELCVEAISDKATLQRIFERHMGKPIGLPERIIFENIVDKIQGHTLVLELIAKQVANSHISLSEANALVDEHGFSGMAPEKIDYEKDGLTGRTTIGNIIDALFEANKLSEDKRMLLKTFSLVGLDGIDVKWYQDILKLKSLDNINEAVADGWLNLNGNILTMHSVIQEAIHRWEWLLDYKKMAEELLTYFYIEITLEATKNNYPKKIHDAVIISQSMMDNNLENKTLKKVAAWRDKYLENQYQKKGIVGRIHRERMSRISDDLPADNTKLEKHILHAEKILGQCKKEKDIKELEIYVDLLYATVLYMPSYREDFIVSETEKILAEKKDFVIEKTKELLQRDESKNPITIMKLYRNLVMIHMEKGDLVAAEDVLSKAERLANKAKMTYVYAQYYDLLSDYYDILLDGCYDAVTSEEEELLELLLAAIEKTLRYSKKNISKDGEHLYAKNLLAKATILLRSNYEKISEIKALIEEAKKVIVKNTLPYAEVRHQYYMVYAWYYAFVHENIEETKAYLYLAKELAEKIAKTDLNMIDETLVPGANIYLEIGCYSESMRLLNEAVRVCLEKEALEVYSRKKSELCNYLRDVANTTEEPSKYMRYIDFVDSDSKDVELKKSTTKVLDALCWVAEHNN